MNTGYLSAAAVRLQAVLGERMVTVEELSQLSEGLILELDSLAGEPIELYAAGKKIAKAEVVVIDETFGVRITEVVSEE